jgi:hypothetical protein
MNLLRLSPTVVPSMLKECQSVNILGLLKLHLRLMLNGLALPNGIAQIATLVSNLDEAINM